jgi:serine/threonine-protein kinase HipA
MTSEAKQTPGAETGPQEKATAHAMAPDEAFVWIWLPGQVQPVVCGRMFMDGGRYAFNYGRSYLARPDATAIYETELPLQAGALRPLPGLAMAGALRDAAPDAWGRRVILNRLLGRKAGDLQSEQLDELTYLLQSGSDRTGALDFQARADQYVARSPKDASLEELMTAAERVEAGVPITPEFEQALFHGSSLGGARPKALVDDGEARLIAKFSSQSDLYNVVKAEFLAMRLAQLAGLMVAPVRLARAAGKDVLLVHRFDRSLAPSGWTRRRMVSALTVLGLDEMMGRYASYQELAEIIRLRFAAPSETLRELFSRLVFNVLTGNTDDHARNTSAFSDGARLELTPAYDICPQGRSGGEATQAMLVVGDDRMSQLTTCLAAAPGFLLKLAEAEAIIVRQVDVIRAQWGAVCEEAHLSKIDRAYFWRRQFLNPFAFEGLEGPLATRLQA